jgi:hypothetical protein
MMDVLREKVLPTKDKVIIVSKCNRNDIVEKFNDQRNQDKKFVHRTRNLSTGQENCPQDGKCVLRKM